MNLTNYATKIKLKGTPNQVKWAALLRKKRTNELDKGGIRKLLLAMRPHVTEDLLQELRCVSQRNILRLAHGVGQAMVQNPSARWWIETRESLPYHNVKEQLDRCVAHYRKTKPFK